MKNKVCQSCGMGLDQENDRGTNKDQSKSDDFCIYCFNDGEFTKEDLTFDEMVDISLRYSKAYQNAASEAEKNHIKDLTKDYMSGLKRWKKKDDGCDCHHCHCHK
ncbi:MAG: zinc ribbon domain-containing protein [Erysipelotrichaceae bacterium]|jgi:hypothetical protein|nr:zinc ribbon domain-containing protein [Erysipelotrichaceae bacterium]